MFCRFFALFGLLLVACRPAEKETTATTFPAAPASAIATPSDSSSVSPLGFSALPDIRSFELAAREALHVELEEQHLDVVVEVYGPSDEKILSFDSPTGGVGLERVCLVAEDPGRYQIVIRSLDGSAGRFRLTRIDASLADDRDRDCWRATQLFAAAEARLSYEGSKLIPEYQDAARLWRNAKAPYREALARIRLGSLNFSLGKLEEEADSYQRAVELFSSLEARPYELATALRLLAHSRWRQGRVSLAEDLLSKASTLARDAGAIEPEVAARDSLALLKNSQGEAHLAVREIKKNLEIWQREGRPDKEAESLHFLGQIYAEELSKFDEAIDSLDRAIEIWRRLGRAEELANTLILKGWASYRGGDSQGAIGFFEQALQLSQAAGNQPSAASALDRLGTTYRSLGRLEEAREAFERSLDISRASGNLRDSAHTEGNLGLVLLARGETAEGKAHLERALALLRRFSDRSAMAQALVGLAEAERTLGDLSAALGRYQEAVALLDSLRLSARYQGGRLPPDPIWQRYYEGYIDLLVDAAERDGSEETVAAAFEVAELNRTRNLYEILLEADIELRSDADLEVLEHERDLIAQYDVLERQQTGSADPNSAQRLRALGLELEAVRDDIRRSNPRFMEIRDPPKIELREIQALLGPDTYILSIVLGERRSFLFKVSANSIEHYVLGPRSRLERQARAAYAGLVRRKKPGLGQARFAAQELSRELLSRVDLPPASSRLVIATDGALAYIPFAALPRPDQPADLLIDSYEMVQLPSVAVVPPLIRRSAMRQRPRKEVAIFAGPVFSPDDPLLDGLVSALRASPSKTPFGPIPYAATEAQAILELFPEDLRLAALGFDARLDLLHTGELRDYRILHFATHALADEEHPERSRLLLSHFDRAGRPLRGDLRLAELYTLDLPADLIVLSACRTALGQPVQGNGLVGLTHGFFYAGASRLVVSLWDVDDKATAELMTRFYRRLREGKVPPGEALRRAQLDLRRSPRYSLPYYWAGFIIQGDWNSLPNKGPSSDSCLLETRNLPVGSDPLPWLIPQGTGLRSGKSA